mgnify:CR=1 FL=1
MDTILEMAIDLAVQLQADPRCEAVLAATKAADEDETLQNLISEFNLKRMAINNEESKEEADAEKLRQLNQELRSTYAAVMANDKMMAYNDAKADLDALMNKIQLAFNLAVQGQDPNLAAQESSCSGDCSSCGGCH